MLMAGRESGVTVGRHTPVANGGQHRAMTFARALRIAVVTETYPPEVNGVATTIAQVVQGLRARGHTLQLLRPRRDADDAGEHGQAWSVVTLRGLPIPRYPQLRMGLPATARCLELWTAQRPDVVHIATEGPLGWSALRAARRLQLPVTSDFRTNFHAYSRHYGIGWMARPIQAYLRRFHNRSGCTMVPTAALRNELERHGFERLVVVARGVDTQRFDPQRRSAALRTHWGVAAHQRVVLCVGRLAPEKNLDTLIRAFEAMRVVDPALRLVFVGDGPLRAPLAARCPDAIFAGLRSGDELAAHYASGDLLLFSSLTETFGNVTTEAMASGLPVLAYGYAAAAQLLRHRENGLLAPFGERDAFIQQARVLAADAAAARAMGVAARRTALTLAWDGIVRQIEIEMRALIPGSRVPYAEAFSGDWARVDVEH
jgi:glycosyltransferase involved in cell wall biosynthesis